MVLPKNFMMSLQVFDDTKIVIIALCLFLTFLAISFAFFRSLLSKLNIYRVFSLPIPVVLIIVVVFLSVSSVVSLQPFVCSSCHPMKQSTQAWKASSHKSIGCISCHKKTTVLAMPIQNLEEMRMTLSWVSHSYQTPISSTVGNKACLSCHSDIRHGVVTKFRTMMSHAEVIQADIPCSDCHNGVGHKHQGQENVSKMEKCSGCHNDEQASSRCQTCHLDKVWLGMKPDKSWGIVHDKDWPKTHGSRSLYACKICHSEKDCTRCHLMAPHPEGWPFIHGQEAKKNPRDCVVCHKQDGFCRDCHGITMPHPASWMPIHKMEVEIAGSDVCRGCHRSEECNRCHQKHDSDVVNMRKEDG